MAGGISGSTVDFVLHPLDTLKTRLQARKSQVRINKGRLFRGLASAMAGSFPSAATFWTAYEGSKRFYTDALPSVPAPLVHVAAASTAEVFTAAVRNPFEVVKQQMQAGMHSSTPDAIRSLVRAEGVRGFYAGYLTLVARDIPFDALQFTLYEFLKSSWARFVGRDLTLTDNAALGSIAGGVTAALTTPLDVVKTRLMTQHGVTGESRYLGFRDAFKRIAAEEGPAVLFAGTPQRVAWISLGGAIFFGTFEEARRRLDSVLPA